MFGIIWYRTKVLNICSKEFNYSVSTPGSQQELFNRATRGAFENKLNEYDGAIAVMLAVVRTLISPTSGNAEEFYVDVLFKIISIISKSKMGQDLLSIHVMEYPEHFSIDFMEKWPQLKFIELFIVRPVKMKNKIDVESNMFSESENCKSLEEISNSEAENKSTKEQRLIELRDLREKNLINDEEYSDAKKEVLRS